MKLSNRTKTTATLLMLGMLLSAGNPTSKLVFAQNSPPQPSAASDKKASDKEVPLDEYQRSSQVYYMQRFGKSGWQRGQEIYYMKCWMCHNDFTTKADPTGPPTLRGLYKRPKLMSGQPVNDQTVMNQIREGSSRMPSYRSILNDKDLADLVAYLKNHCCWDENNPPANPRYRAQ